MFCWGKTQTNMSQDRLETERLRWRPQPWKHVSKPKTKSELLKQWVLVTKHWTITGCYRRHCRQEAGSIDVDIRMTHENVLRKVGDITGTYSETVTSHIVWCTALSHVVTAYNRTTVLYTNLSACNRKKQDCLLIKGRPPANAQTMARRISHRNFWTLLYMLIDLSSTFPQS